jgi:NhaP-type Na+/H+ or K+/H+ antiporter
MAWDHLSINKPHLVYIVLGGFTSLFMLCSSFIKERLYIGEATVATVCGIIFGPHAADLINPGTWGNVDQITLEFSRIVLVVQCFAVGVELPKYYMEKHWRSVTLLLIPVMTFGWLVTSLFIWWMVPTLNWLESLVVASCVTATDPVLASSVVGKGKFAKRVPKHLRDLLSAESGCNDGMAFPFVYLGLYILHYMDQPNEVALNWIVITILYECVFGAIFGFTIGYISRRGIRWAEKHDLIDRESFLVFYFVLALFCAGSGSILGVDDLLVGFAAGVGFSNDGWFTQKTEESHVSNVIDLLLNLAYFVYFGTIVPWEQFNSPELGTAAWRLVIIAIFVILFRRIPIMLALKPIIADIKSWREALFAGHFGPIGVGAIFVAILARAELETGGTTPLAELPPENTAHFHLIALIWPITTFLVITSIIVHGSSIAVFTLGKHINTLSLTMSYTTAHEDGPSWMNRLPRISSQSKSMSKMSDTDLYELKLEDLPPGTLPPIGVPGAFLKRQKEEDTPTREGSRTSSLIPKRRKKRTWDSNGFGPGGPVSQSAITPIRRTQSEATSTSVTPENNDEKIESPIGEVQHDSQMEAIMTSGYGEPDQHKSDAERNPSGVEVFEEGNDLVFENEDGDVLSVERTPHGVKVDAEEKAIKEELKEGLESPALGYKNLKKKLGVWMHKDADAVEKGNKSHERKRPALAYQFGNTVSFMMMCRNNENTDLFRSLLKMKMARSSRNTIFRLRRLNLRQSHLALPA